MGLGRARLPQKIARLRAHREDALCERCGGVSGSEETFSWRRPAQRENRGHQDQPALVAAGARKGGAGFWLGFYGFQRVGTGLAAGWVLGDESSDVGELSP